MAVTPYDLAALHARVSGLYERPPIRTGEEFIEALKAELELIKADLLAR